MRRVAVAICGLFVVGCGEPPPEPDSTNPAVNWPDEISERFEKRGQETDQHVDRNE